MLRVYSGGRWVAEDGWPSPRIGRRSFALGGGVHSPVQTLGTEAGVWCGEGQPADDADDQRRDDALSLCLDLDPLPEPLELLGFPEVTLELAADRPNALVCVRLCDVGPDGSSALVSRGLLNLTHRDGHERPVPVEPGQRMSVTLRLDAVGYTVPAGHRLRVAPPFEVEQLAPGPVGRRLRRDLATGLLEQEFDWDVGGTVRLVPIDLVSSDESRTVYSIVEGDPLSASVRFRAVTGMARGDWSVRAEVASTMSADAEAFHVTSALDAYEGETRVFARTWSWCFPRDGV
jgi:hypothetical protein